MPSEDWTFTATVVTRGRTMHIASDPGSLVDQTAACAVRENEDGSFTVLASETAPSGEGVEEALLGAVLLQALAQK